jgi:hypothetical protein
MATGEVQVFNAFAESIGDGRIDMDTDTLKLAIIDAVITPTAADATPAWGATSDQRYDSNEVSSAGSYTANGETLGSVTWIEAAGVCTLVAANEVIAQDAGGFTDGTWGIIYSDTAANKDAIAFVDMGGPVSQVAGAITFDWFETGRILTVTVNDTFT